MKKLLSVTLIFILLILSGCNNKIKEVAAPDGILNEYLNNVESFEVPVREFGEPVSHVDMTDEMVVGILYPETEYSFLNTEIIGWIKEISDYYKNELSGKKKNSAELTVDFESFVVNEDVVSIKMKGVFLSSHLAHPVDVFKTFNVNLKEEKFLSAYDIFTEEGLKVFTEKIAAQSGIEKNNVNEQMLKYMVLKKDSVEVILNRGDYLPMSEGTKALSFKYSDIKELLIISFDKKSELPREEKNEEITMAPAIPGYNEEPSHGKRIAFTFDDGPSIHTERLLDIFKKYGGKGTFFVVGNLIDKRPDTLRRIVAEGHEIGNHGWDHRQLTGLDYECVKDQIMMTRAKILTETGVDSKIMRPPYGSVNNEVKEIGKELGVSFVNWSVDTLDWKTKSVQGICDEIVKNVKKGSIILCHDIYKTTVSAMEMIIPALIENGYELVTVTELLEDEPEAGRVYYKK